MKPIKILFLVLVLWLLGSIACAESTVFTVDFDTIDPAAVTSDEYVRTHLQSDAPALRIRKHLTDSDDLQAEVRLTVTRSDTCQTVFEKYYGLVSGDFQSEAIYLPFIAGDMAPYMITLQTNATRHVLPYLHKSSWAAEMP